MKYHSPLCFPSHNIKKNTETHPPPTREVIIEQPLICHVVPPFECSEGIVSVPMLVLLCISQQLCSFRSSHQRFSVKKCVLRSFAKFTGKHLCQRASGLQLCKKETLAQVFSCQFCQFSKSTFFYRRSLGSCFYSFTFHFHSEI